MDAHLNATERTILARCEVTIRDGLETFYAVGRALQTVREGRLYRDGYPTFEGYCGERWGMGASRARQLIGAAAVVESVTAGNSHRPGPQSERQARALVPVPEEVRGGVWDAAPEGCTAAELEELADIAEEAVGMDELRRMSREQQAEAIRRAEARVLTRARGEQHRQAEGELAAAIEAALGKALKLVGRLGAETEIFDQAGAEEGIGRALECVRAATGGRAAA